MPGIDPTYFKVTKLGFKELVTQMYFRREALNDADLILQDLTTLERESVIVDFTPSPEGMEAGSQMGFFEISLRPVETSLNGKAPLRRLSQS